MKLKVLILISALVLLPLIASAIVVERSGTEITVTGVEPVTNADGTDLKDLHHLNVYYQKATDPAPVKSPDIPATAPTGGGDINYTTIVPVGDNEDVDVAVWGTATDDAGNESAETERMIKNFDTQAPGTWQ